MSEMGAKIGETEDSLKEITDCSICAVTYREPIMLSCIHTFCKGCLQHLVLKLEKSPGEEIPCHTCKKKFLIPDKECNGLQKNLFVERLIELRDNMKPSINPQACEYCLDEDGNLKESELPIAEFYCTECQQKLCRECHSHHLKSKLSKSHKTVKLDDSIIVESSNTKITKPEFCEKHTTKPLDIYCKVCDDIACSTCLVESHKNHEFVTVDIASEEFKKIIHQNVARTSEFLPQLQKKTEKLDSCKTVMTDKYKDLEAGINKRREELKAMIDTHSDNLLKELKKKQKAYLKRMNTCAEEIENLMSCLESYETYCKQMTTLGSASIICKDVKSLRLRADELVDMCSLQMQNALESPALRLKTQQRREVVESFLTNYLGEVADPIKEVHRAKEKTVTEFKSISRSFSIPSAVKGMVILGVEFFVAVEIYHKECRRMVVEVYDLKTLWFKRKWEDKQLNGIEDMKSDESSGLLYVLTAATKPPNKLILVLDPLGSLISSWSVIDAINRISVSDDSSVICITREKKQIEEYSSDGHLMCIIPLTSTDDAICPTYAVKLSPDRFAVGYKLKASLGRICIVDKKGNCLKSTATVEGDVQLKSPFYLGKDRDSNVVVVDRELGRLTVLDSNLKSLNQPTQLYPPKLISLQQSFSNQRCWNMDTRKIIVDDSHKRIFVGKGDHDDSDVAVVNFS